MLKSKLVLSIILIVACLAQLFSCVFQGNFQNAFMIGLAPSDYGFEIYAAFVARMFYSLLYKRLN